MEAVKSQKLPLGHQKQFFYSFKVALHLFPFLGYPVQWDRCSREKKRNHSHIKGYRTLFQEAGNHRYSAALVSTLASRNTKTIAELIPLVIKLAARGGRGYKTYVKGIFK